MTQSKSVIITGITGQDGAYLSKFLLEKNYKVIGLLRSYTHKNTYRLSYLNCKEDIIFEECDLSDLSQVIRVIEKYRPVEIYNLAAQSSVALSFSQPIGTISFNITSTINLLEAIKMTQLDIKFYQASSSEMFGRVQNLPITENTAFHPLSPYAISKASAHWITINYREAYGIFSACGILFNHESFLRSDNFFLKKVISNALDIRFGKLGHLEVGNIDIKRDFGYAPKYVEAMWLILQQDQPEDFIICSGTSISLRKIIEHIFDRLQISHHKIVISPAHYRPTDIEDIYGTNKAAKNKLKWNYNLDFFDVIDLILEEELRNR